MSDVRPMYGKNEQNTQNMCAGQEDLLFAVFDQSIFKVSKKNWRIAKKEWFGGTLKKSSFFDFVIIQIVLNYAVLDRSEAHSSRPRTYLPSRSGATHALRVQSSYNNQLPVSQLISLV